MSSNILDIVYISIFSYIKCNKINNEPRVLFGNGIDFETQINKRFENLKSSVIYLYNEMNRRDPTITRLYRSVRTIESRRNMNIFIIYLRSMESELFNYILYNMNNSFLREEPMMRLDMLAIWIGFQKQQESLDLVSLTNISLDYMKTVLLESSRLLLNNYRFNHDIRSKLHRLIHDIPIVFDNNISRQQLLLFIKTNSLFLIAIIFNWKNVF